MKQRGRGPTHPCGWARHGVEGPSYLPTPSLRVVRAARRGVVVVDAFLGRRVLVPQGDASDGPWRRGVVAF
jgi:hypothetical protein